MIVANLLAFLSVTLFVSCTQVSYSEHQVFRCHPKNREQLDALHELDESEALNVDFWLETRKVGAPVDIMVPRNQRSVFNTIMKRFDVPCDVMIENVEDAILNEQKQLQLKDNSYFGSYHTYQEVHAYIDSLAAEYPQLAKTSSIGKTYEGKDIKIITISTKPNSGKPSLWFDGGLHAREWITVATVTYMADAIVRGYGVDGNTTSLLDNFDIIICPILNVDGYDYTWNGDRMWRKTRSPNTRSPCVGTDPNRNWAFHWGEAGTSDQPCSDSYQGSAPASEVEVQAVQSYLYNNRATLKGYINFHSYSQLWMSPWGYTYELPDDYQIQNDLSKTAVAALQAVHGTVYEYGPIAATIYPASGSSADYAYGVCGIVYSYGVELRDTGEFGFLLPPAEIIPSGEETYAGILAMGQFIAQNL